MKSAPYNPETLHAIRQGASAASLGWDLTFYASVCRKHGLEQTKPPLDVSAPIPSPKPVCEQPILPAVADDSVIYKSQSRALHRGSKSVRLAHRQSEVFVLLLKGSSDGPVTGALLAERMGMSSQSGIGSQIKQLRGKLKTLNLVVAARIGRTSPGYWLTNSDGSAITIIVSKEPLR